MAVMRRMIDRWFAQAFFPPQSPDESARPTERKRTKDEQWASDEAYEIRGLVVGFIETAIPLRQGCGPQHREGTIGCIGYPDPDGTGSWGRTVRLYEDVADEP